MIYSKTQKLSVNENNKNMINLISGDTNQIAVIVWASLDVGLFLLYITLGIGLLYMQLGWVSFLVPGKLAENY